MKRNVRQRRGSKVGGILLIIIGFFWFSKKVGWIPIATSSAGVFWPIVVTVLGVSVLFGSRYNRDKKEIAVEGQNQS